MNTKVVKIHEAKGALYFIDGQRVEVYDDIGVLQELLGENLQEYWLPSKATLDPNLRELVDDIESADFLDEVEAVFEANPELVVDASVL